MHDTEMTEYSNTVTDREHWSDFELMIETPNLVSMA